MNAMAPLCFCAPRLLFMGQLLWLLVQAAQPLEWPQDAPQLTSEHPGPIKPWSLHSPKLPPLSPHVLTPRADPGGSDDLGSSARPQMLDPPQKLTDNLLRFLGRDSPGERPPEVDQFAVPHQDLHHDNAPSPSVTGGPADVEITVTSEPTKVVESSLAQQEAPVQPEAPVQEAPVQEASVQEAPVQPPEYAEEVEPSLAQEETPAQPLGPPGETEPSLSEQETPTQTSESSGEDQSSESQLETPVKPPDLPSVTGKPADVLITITPEPTTEVGPPVINGEAIVPPLIVGPSVAQPEAPTVPPELPDDVTAQPPEGEEMTDSSLGSDQLEPPTPELNNEVETLAPQETLDESSMSPEQLEPQLGLPLEEEQSPIDQEVPSQVEELPEEFLSSQQESSSQPSRPPVSELPPAQETLPTPETTTRPSIIPSVSDTMSFSPQDLELMFRSDSSPFSKTTVQHVALIVTVPVEASREVEPIPIQQVTFYPTQSNRPSQSPGFPENIGFSSAQQTTTTQTETSTQQQVLSQNQAQDSTAPSVTFQPVDLELTITPEPIKHSTAKKKTTALPTFPEITFQTIQETSTWLPVYQEVMVPTQETSTQQQILTENQAHYASSPSFTFKPADVEIMITAAPNVGVEHSTPVPPKPHEVTLLRPHLGTTNTPSKPPEVTLPHADMGTTNIALEPPDVTLLRPYPGTTIPQSNHEETSVMAPPFDVEITLTPKPNIEVASSPTLQGKPIQLPAPYKEIIAKAPEYYEITLPTTSPTPNQVSSSVGVQPTDRTMTLTPLLTVVTENSATLNKPTTLSKYSETTLQQLNLTEFTIPQVEPDQTATQIPEIYATEKDENVTTNSTVCELCTCQNETLWCVGLAPVQKLHRVPVLEPDSYNGIFTILNFQGNDISRIDENTWKPYRWVEKLILSENSLTELHKYSFKGLLCLRYLDLSCNKIQYIERGTFEELPFLQFINLSCNSLTELSFGTFQAWHGLQFLHNLILNHNPLTTIEDSHLFKLPALKYLDMGTTQVTLSTVENILLMTLELEKLILPSHMACCLCQFKNNIEVVCKTVKLRCDNACQTDSTRCFQEASVGSVEGAFMQVLQARKKNTSTELIIEPENPASDENDVTFSGFLNEQLDFNDKMSALNYILPYFTGGNLEDVESTLLPFIELLFSNVQNGDNAMEYLENNTKNPSLSPESNNLTYKNKLKKLHFPENLLDTEIQEKIDEVKKEKTAMLMKSRLLSPKFKHQIFQKKLETAQPQENSLEDIESTEKRLQRLKRVFKEPKGILQILINKMRKQSAQPLGDNVVQERRLRRPIPRELEQLHMVQRPRKLVGNSLLDASFTNEHKAPISTVQQTNEAQWEYLNANTDAQPKSEGEGYSSVASPGHQFEIQLNQQLRSLIPNNDVRRLISHVIRTLKMDCSETRVQLSCAKLISRTGLLMRLLSEEQEIKVSKAEWDTDQWKSENYISESTEALGDAKEHEETNELTKGVPGYGYNNKLILVISVTVAVTILIIIFCLIEIYSHKRSSQNNKEQSSRSFFAVLCRTPQTENQEGSSWIRCPLWLRDMYRPLSATRKKNMAQKLHDKDSSDEDEIVNKDAGDEAFAPEGAEDYGV